MIDFDYADVSYVPREGKLFVDGSALSFVGDFGNMSREKERAELVRGRNCLKLFKRRRGEVVFSKDASIYVDNKVLSYQGRKIGVKRLKSRDRETKRSARGDGMWVKSAPLLSSSFQEENKRCLKFYRSFQSFLDDRVVENFLGESRDDFDDVRLYVSGGEDSQGLHLFRKNLLVGMINSGNGCGLFSSNDLMMRTYREAVDYFSLKDCFICDSVRSEVEWL